MDQKNNKRVYLDFRKVAYKLGDVISVNTYEEKRDTDSDNRFVESFDVVVLDSETNEETKKIRVTATVEHGMYRFWCRECGGSSCPHTQKVKHYIIGE